jgi:hypothetical protein
MSVRPREVNWALSLRWTILGIGLFMLAVNWTYYASLVPIPKLIVNFTISYAFTVFVNLRIARGENWARITALVLSLVELPLEVFSVSAKLFSPLTARLTMLALVMEGVALVLLFTAPGKLWFVTRQVRK